MRKCTTDGLIEKSLDLETNLVLLSCPAITVVSSQSKARRREATVPRMSKA
jgi:hypothetical protein